jgi:hypothetical protein
MIRISIRVWVRAWDMSIVYLGLGLGLCFWFGYG